MQIDFYSPFGHLVLSFLGQSSDMTYKLHPCLTAFFYDWGQKIVLTLDFGQQPKSLKHLLNFYNKPSALPSWLCLWFSRLCYFILSYIICFFIYPSNNVLAVNSWASQPLDMSLFPKTRFRTTIFGLQSSRQSKIAANRYRWEAWPLSLISAFSNILAYFYFVF